MPNRTALPSAAVAETGAYRFAKVACYDLRLTENQRKALVDGAEHLLTAGAAELLTAAGIRPYLVRCMLRLLDGFDPAEWTVLRAETPRGIVVIDDLDRTVTVPAWLSYDEAFDNVTLRMEELTRPEVKRILGRRRDWTTTERASAAPSLWTREQEHLAARVEDGARLADLPGYGACGYDLTPAGRAALTGCGAR